MKPFLRSLFFDLSIIESLYVLRLVAKCQSFEEYEKWAASVLQLAGFREAVMLTVGPELSCPDLTHDRVPPPSSERQQQSLMWREPGKSSPQLTAALLSNRSGLEERGHYLTMEHSRASCPCFHLNQEENPEVMGSNIPTSVSASFVIKGARVILKVQDSL